MIAFPNPISNMTRWWQLKYFLFSPRKLGKMNPFWRAYFSDGLVQPPTIWVFPKIEVPPNHPILIGFSLINHPFWGTPIFGNTYIYEFQTKFPPIFQRWNPQPAVSRWVSRFGCLSRCPKLKQRLVQPSTRSCVFLREWPWMGKWWREGICRSIC